MPLTRYFSVAGFSLLASLFVLSAWLSEDESHLRFEGSFYDSALYAPRQSEIAATTEQRYTRDVTPALRVKEVFAVFVPNERRRNRRDS